MKVLLVALLTALSFVAMQPAVAKGFKTPTLWQLPIQIDAFAGGRFSATSTAPDRITVFCADCTAPALVDIQLANALDPLENRLRDGTDTQASLQAGCRADDCTIRMIRIGAAIGWTRQFAQDGLAGSETRLYLDGWRLWIRSTARTADIAWPNGQTALRTLAPLIIGD